MTPGSRTAIVYIYTVDVTLKDGVADAAKTRGPRPDMSIPLRGAARRRAFQRPPGGDRCRAVRVVRGADPGADGVPAHHSGSRQDRARADQGYLGLLAPLCAQPGIQCAVYEGSLHVFRRQIRTARSRTFAYRGRKVLLTEFVKAGAPRGNPVCEQAAYRHIPPGRNGRGDPQNHRGSGRRVSLSEQGGGYRHFPR